MPLHDHTCQAGHTFERLIPIAELHVPQHCQCGAPAKRVFLRFPMAYVQGDICYDSPVDGRHITNKHARIEDLARHNCVPYDPSMKAEHMRRIKESDDAIGRDIERHFDAEVSAMPARKRELLEQELRSGADLEITRGSA